MPQLADDDSTVQLKGPVQRPAPLPGPSPRVPRWLFALPVAAALFGLGGWLLWPTQRVGSPETPPASDLVPLAERGPRIDNDRPSATGDGTEPAAGNNTEQAAAVPVPVGEAPVARPIPDNAPGEPAPPRQNFVIETATEQRVLDHAMTETSEGLTVFRLKQNPRILVLDFASLREQGRMLNRAAALVEKFGVPHDRLLSDAELDTAIRASGDTAETFYYGHDYGARSLIRFFELAEREHVPLSVQEETLRNLIREEGWFEPRTRASLISIPRIGADEHVTRVVRATILHHELSHGEYFTNSSYAGFVHKFWRHTLTEPERQQIRSHLRSLGYDPSLDEVMENEAQAYLMFTDSPDFFTPDRFGMSRGRVNELRNGFHRGMPGGWLRDSLGQSLAVSKAASPRP